MTEGDVPEPADLPDSTDRPAFPDVRLALARLDASNPLRVAGRVAYLMAKTS